MRKKVGNDFGRDQNAHINALIVLVSTRLSSSGPGHHHRDDKHGSYLLRSTHALIVFQTQRSLLAKQEVHAGVKAAAASLLDHRGRGN